MIMTLKMTSIFPVSGSMEIIDQGLPKDTLLNVNVPYCDYKDIKGNLVYQLEKKYDIDTFQFTEGENNNMFGNVINVFMDSIGQTIPEYLVNFQYFIHIMKENGFKPVIPDKMSPRYSSIFRKDNFNNENIGYFSKVIEKIPEIEKTDPDFNNKFKGAKDLYSARSIKILSSFNNYFIFQKVSTRNK